MLNAPCSALNCFWVFPLGCCQAALDELACSHLSNCDLSSRKIVSGFKTANCYIFVCLNYQILSYACAKHIRKREVPRCQALPCFDSWSKSGHCNLNAHWLASLDPSSAAGIAYRPEPGSSKAGTAFKSSTHPPDKGIVRMNPGAKLWP